MLGAFGPENGQDFRRRPCGLRTALRVISNFVIAYSSVCADASASLFSARASSLDSLSPSSPPRGARSAEEAKTQAETGAAIVANDFDEEEAVAETAAPVAEESAETAEAEAETADAEAETADAEADEEATS